MAATAGASPDKALPPPPPEPKGKEKEEDGQLKSPTGSTKAPSLKLNLADSTGVVDSPSSPTQEDAFIPPTDPNGRPKMSGEEPASAIDDRDTAFILLSGVALTPRMFQSLLTRFDQYIHTHAAPGSEQAQASELSTRQALASRQKSSILGTYEKTFSGEELVSWLSDNVEGLGGEWDRCVEASEELVRMGHVSRIGVVGRGFEPEDDVHFILRLNPTEGTGVNVANLRKNLSSYANNYANTAQNYASSGYNYASTNMPHVQQYANTNLSQIQTNITSAVSGISERLPSVSSPSTTASAIPGWAKNYLPAAVASNEPAHVRLRHEANRASEAYHAGVAEAEARRLEMEERIERGLRTWERWERERLGVIRSILKHYEVALQKLPKRLSQGDEATALAVETYNPEAE